jgi:hypothetical protein
MQLWKRLQTGRIDREGELAVSDGQRRQRVDAIHADRVPLQEAPAVHGRPDVARPAQKRTRIELLKMLNGEPVRPLRLDHSRILMLYSAIMDVLFATASDSHAPAWDLVGFICG